MVNIREIAHHQIQSFLAQKIATNTERRQEVLIVESDRGDLTIPQFYRLRLTVYSDGGAINDLRIKVVGLIDLLALILDAIVIQIHKGISKIRVAKVGVDLYRLSLGDLGSEGNPGHL